MSRSYFKFGEVDEFQNRIAEQVRVLTVVKPS